MVLVFASLLGEGQGITTDRLDLYALQSHRRRILIREEAFRKSLLHKVKILRPVIQVYTLFEVIDGGY
jgi:hypothetical protein